PAQTWRRRKGRVRSRGHRAAAQRRPSGGRRARLARVRRRGLRGPVERGAAGPGHRERLGIGIHEAAVLPARRPPVRRGDSSRSGRQCRESHHAGLSRRAAGVPPEMTRVFWLKAGTGATGLVVGLAGMATARRWLAWIAVILMGVAFVSRLAERRNVP